MEDSKSQISTCVEYNTDQRIFGCIASLIVDFNSEFVKAINYDTYLNIYESGIKNNYFRGKI